MSDVEISVLAALDAGGLFLKNPERYPGYSRLLKDFLTGHCVLMGRDTWFDFEHKDNTRITPWILSSNQHFQMYTRQRYPHVRFVDTTHILHSYYPLKGIWWVLGGHSVQRAVLPYATNIEATLVKGAVGTVDLLHDGSYEVAKRCPHPYNKNMECVQYVRTAVTAQPCNTAIHLQQMQAS